MPSGGAHERGELPDRPVQRVTELLGPQRDEALLDVLDEHLERLAAARHLAANPRFIALVGGLIKDFALQR